MVTIFASKFIIMFCKYILNLMLVLFDIQKLFTSSKIILRTYNDLELMHVNGNKSETFLNFHFGGQKIKYGENFQTINGSFI
jgi:hypothetical protein